MIVITSESLVEFRKHFSQVIHPIVVGHPAPMIEYFWKGERTHVINEHDCSQHLYSQGGAP